MLNKVLKDRFHISVDEMESRMQKQTKLHDEPIQKAVIMLEIALDKVLAKLGVNVELGNIPAQQDQLGIVVTEETREELAKINGFFVFVNRNGELIPYAWIGAVRIDHLGECFCDVQYFQDERLEKIGGEKLIQ